MSVAASQEFEVISRVPATGRAGLMISCSRCGDTETFSLNSGKRNCDLAFAGRQFRNKGWQVGNSRRSDVCPACQKKPARLSVVPPSSKEPPMQKPSLVPLEPPPKADLPRDPTREESKRIWAEINTHYLEDLACYAGGETDETIATRLKCPRAWVSDIRDQFFGPAGNEAVRSIRTELAKASEAIARMEKNVEAEIDRIGEVKRAVADLSARLSRMERGV